MKTLQKFITQSYSSIRYKSRRRGDPMPDITKKELEKWLIDNGIKDKWIEYIESGFDKNLRPSIDRINDYGVYEFSNMQLITWRENHIKGVNGKKHHRNSQNQNLTKPVFIWSKSGEFIKECKNHKEAAHYLGCHTVSISRAVTGKRKTIKKHVLTQTYTTPLQGKNFK